MASMEDSASNFFSTLTSLNIFGINWDYFNKNTEILYDHVSFAFYTWAPFLLFSSEINVFFISVLCFLKCLYATHGLVNLIPTAITHSIYAAVILYNIIVLKSQLYLSINLAAILLTLRSNKDGILILSVISILSCYDSNMEFIVDCTVIATLIMEVSESLKNSPFRVMGSILVAGSSFFYLMAGIDPQNPTTDADFGQLFSGYALLLLASCLSLAKNVERIFPVMVVVVALYYKLSSSMRSYISAGMDDDLISAILPLDELIEDQKLLHN